eukprot:12038488-Prorocentrum_lima.AAC.1
MSVAGGVVVQLLNRRPVAQARRCPCASLGKRSYLPHPCTLPTYLSIMVAPAGGQSAASAAYRYADDGHGDG